MAAERKNVEIFVGLFILIGFSFIAVMAVMFGRVGQGVRDFYQINVEFPNASGIIKDSNVLLAGAIIGHVAEQPVLVGKSYAVRLKLNIRGDIKIPKKSTFTVGSSGLLGDKFVDVVPQKDFDPNDVIGAGETVAGTRLSGFEELTQKGGQVMDQLVVELEEIKKITTSVNDGLLHEKNLKNLEETFANLKATTASITESARKIDPILANANSAAESAKATMKGADTTVAELREAIADFRKTADAATKTIESAKGLVDAGKVLMKKAADGDGALGTLISDRQTAENLRIFIANLRRSGPLFYKDRPIEPPTRERSRR